MISTGTADDCTGTISAGAVAYVTTVRQGGRVEHQRLTLATEAGYVLGDYFRLQYAGSAPDTTDCLEWGASAADMSAALSALPSIEDTGTVLPFDFNTAGKDINPSATLSLASGFVDGHLKRGDVIRVVGANDGDNAEFTVKSISADGTSVTLETTFRAATGAGDASVAVTRVVPDAVTVARSGTGKSVTEVQRIVVTATSEVVPLTGQGLFRLRWAHDGDEKTTASCLEFGAEAAEVQDALEALLYDLDGSGALDDSDKGHVLVTREGDASAASGFGYEYTFEFKGLAGVSTVVGNVEQLEVRNSQVHMFFSENGALEGISLECAFRLDKYS